MSTNLDQPLVTVLTPVYNGAAFLHECIESVLAQDYQNWKYYIVNNCSTDDTLKIAQSYAAKDPRIRVTTNRAFVSMPENFNTAFGMVSEASRYFKVVCADDWILPQCLSKMVRFMEDHRSVGILCSHQQSGNRVRWQELPRSVTVLTGRDACRLVLLEGAQILGAPTANLYRSDLLRLGKPFFPNDKPHSDTSACFEFLQYCDFGVVHEVLAVERVHAEQITSRIEAFAAGELACLEMVLHYGPRYLTESEFSAQRDAAFDTYYSGLGRALLKLKGRAFWGFQRSGLRELGHELTWTRIVWAALANAIAEMTNPMGAMGKVQVVLRDRLRR